MFVPGSPYSAEILLLGFGFCLLVASLLKGGAAAVRSFGVPGLVAGSLGHLWVFASSTLLLAVLVAMGLSLVYPPAIPWAALGVFVTGVWVASCRLQWDATYRERNRQGVLACSLLLALSAIGLAGVIVTVWFHARYGVR